MPAGGEVLIDAAEPDAGGRHRTALRDERLAATAVRDPDTTDQHGSRITLKVDSGQGATLRSYAQRVS